jgi:hypothetical protein
MVGGKDFRKSRGMNILMRTMRHQVFGLYQQAVAQIPFPLF